LSFQGWGKSDQEVMRVFSSRSTSVTIPPGIFFSPAARSAGRAKFFGGRFGRCADRAALVSCRVGCPLPRNLCNWLAARSSCWLTVRAHSIRVRAAEGCSVGRFLIAELQTGIICGGHGPRPGGPRNMSGTATPLVQVSRSRSAGVLTLARATSSGRVEFGVDLRFAATGVTHKRDERGGVLPASGVLPALRTAALHGDA
jgi:hypothetical protein